MLVSADVSPCDARLGLLCRIPVEPFRSFPSYLLCQVSSHCPTIPSTATIIIPCSFHYDCGSSGPLTPVKDLIHTMDVLLPHRLTSLISSIPFIILNPFFLGAILIFALCVDDFQGFN
jgi:hypothetical protein